jgi:hypothetical protein
MNKDIVKEMFNILLNNFKNTIGIILMGTIIVLVPIGIIWGIYLLLEHFFGEMATGYIFLGFCCLGGLFILLDATISWIKKAYQQAKINIEHKR